MCCSWAHSLFLIYMKSVNTFEKRSSCLNKIHRNINNIGLYTDREVTVSPDYVFRDGFGDDKENRSTTTTVLYHNVV